MAMTVYKSRCTGCGECTDVCPRGAISLNEKKKADINKEKCTVCGECGNRCPADAIIYQ